ncbi:hypothetical protein [Thermococcus prieurii]
MRKLPKLRNSQPTKAIKAQTLKKKPLIEELQTLMKLCLRKVSALAEEWVRVPRFSNYEGVSFGIALSKGFHSPNGVRRTPKIN